MLKKIILGFFLAIFIVAGAAAVVFWQAKEKPAPQETVILGYNEWPGILPYLIAYEKGFFKDAGVNVVLKKEDSYGAMIDDLIKGKIDCTGDAALIDVLMQVAGGANLAVVGATDYSTGADGIVGQKNIKSISELKGKKVAVEEGTLGEFLLIEALRQYNLSLKDIKVINLSAQGAAAAFTAGQVTAAVTYEPYLTEAAKSGNKIFTSAAAPYLIVDTLVFQREFINNKPQAVQAVVDAYFEGADYVEKNSDEANAIGARYFNITAEAFKTQFSGLNSLDKNKNLIAFSHATGEKSLYSNSKNLLDFLRNLEKKVDNIDPDEVILRRFVKSLMY